MPYLKALPERETFREEITRLLDYERFSLPEKRGDLYFFTRNEGLENQSVLYLSEGLDGPPRVLLDPNTLSRDGTVSLADTAVSPDGKILAYGLSHAGSDWREWAVRDVDSARDLDDRIEWVKFSEVSWTADSKGFFYSRYDEPRGNSLQETNYCQKLYYHRVGDPQTRDRLVYERKDHKDWGLTGSVTDDGNYLIVHVRQGTDERNRLYYKDLRHDDEVVELLDDFDASYSFVGNEGTRFWFHTNLDAPLGRLLQIDIRRPGRQHWVELVPQSEDTLLDVAVVHHSLILSYLRNAHSRIEIRRLDGTFVRELPLPGIGAVSGFQGRIEERETFYRFSSFLNPGTIYRYDLATGENTRYRKPKLPFDGSAYETRQVHYESRDGTRIPMFLTHRKDLVRDGGNPTLLYGYGGFNIAMTPRFSVSNLLWIERGGIYAVPNLRGGGEFGEEWHEAGTIANKQNVFDDFIAAAEWLISSRYTSPQKLGMAGGSNGGLLVGACLTQRPDLFGAALPAVGVLDMLRFHKFTIGWAWVSDYGSPDDPDDFRSLYAYSPYHNLRDGIEYPPTLVTTADHDDRVVPSHSFKFAARLQAAQGGSAPVLIRIETKAGHGAGKPILMQIEEAADRMAFLTKHLM